MIKAENIVIEGSGNGRGAASRVVPRSGNRVTRAIRNAGAAVRRVVSRRSTRSRRRG